MTNLFDNSISAIQSGLEDFEEKNAQRSLTSVRNIFAGVILLAKEALCHLAPSADPEIVLADKLRLVSDGSGGITVKQKGKSTVDVSGIFDRFKDFESALPTDVEKRITRLQAARNDIEHKHTSLSHEALKSLIAEIFPVILYFLSRLKKDPVVTLGNSYKTLLTAQEVHESERQRCIETFKNVQFLFDELDGDAFYCESCHSELVEQIVPANTKVNELQCRCNICKLILPAEEAVEQALGHKYYYDLYKNGLNMVETCPECYRDTFVVLKGCVLCKATLSDCARCGDSLTPNDRDFEHTELCSYCGHMSSKDD